uniref:Uncharacterized protein n=1 Tax=Anguilla anguilla TaxID=7936 RepID=A0A0E9UPD6_ANGAN
MSYAMPMPTRTDFPQNLIFSLISNMCTYFCFIRPFATY